MLSQIDPHHCEANDIRFLYEQGNFETAIKICDFAEGGCGNHFLLLSDINYLRGTSHMESNRQDKAIEDQLRARQHFLEARNRSEVKEPNVREAKTLGILGHGHQCRGEFVEAERLYREAIEIWRLHNFRDRPVIWELGLTLSLIPQHKLADAEATLDSILTERAALFGAFDTQSTM